MPYKDLFLPLVCLPLPLMVYLAIQRILIVMESYLSILFFMVISFFVLFMFAHPKIMKFLIVFFETFVVLLFTFRPLIIYLDLVFLYSVR